MTSSREVFAVHPVLEELVKRKWLGRQDGPGLLQEAGRRDPAARPQDASNTSPSEKPRFPSIGATKGVDDVDERLRRMLGGAADDRAAALARTVIYETHGLFGGAHSRRSPTAWWRSTGPCAGASAGTAVRSRAGTRSGCRPTVEKMQAAKIRVPDWVKERIKAGETSFYRKETPARVQQLRPAGGYADDPGGPAGHLPRCCCAPPGKEVERNPSASLLDLGDGVFCLEFHSKMNAIDADIVTLLGKAVDRAEQQGAAPGHRQRGDRGVFGGSQPVRADGGAGPGSVRRRSRRWSTDFQQACYAHCATPGCRWWRRRSGWPWAAAPR